MANEAVPSTLHIPDYLKSALNDAAGVISDSFMDLGQIMRSGQQASQAEQEAIKERAQEQNNAARFAASKKLALEAANKIQSAQFGTNPTAESYVLASMAEDIFSIKRELDTRSKAIQGKLDTKFLDDPVNFIANQFTVGADIVGYAHRADALKLTSDVMDSMLHKSQAAVALNNAIDAGVSLEQVSALEKANLADAAVKVADVQHKMAAMNLTGLNIRKATSMDQVQLMVAANNAEANYQRLEMDKAAAIRAEMSLQLQKEEAAYRRADKQERDEDIAYQQRKLDRVTETAGMNKISVRELKGMNPKTREFLEAAMFDPDFQSGKLGANTAVAIQRANQYLPSLPAGMDYLRDIIMDITAKTPTKNPGYERLSPAEQLALQQKDIETKRKAELESIPPTKGFYSPPPLAKILELPMVKVLPIAAVLASYATTPEYPTDPSMIWKAVDGMVATGKLTSAQAAANLDVMFAQVQVANNTDRIYKRLAIEMLSDKTGYKMTTYTGAGWGSAQVVDYRNRAQMENIFERNKARRSYMMTTQGPVPVDPTRGEQ